MHGVSQSRGFACDLTPVVVCCCRHRAYLARVDLLRRHDWTCSFTGKTGLTFEEAAVSEARYAAHKAQVRFALGGPNEEERVRSGVGNALPLCSPSARHCVLDHSAKHTLPHSVACHGCFGILESLTASHRWRCVPSSRGGSRPTCCALSSTAPRRWTRWRRALRTGSARAVSLASAAPPP